MDHLSSRPVSEPGIKDVLWEGSTLNSARLQGEQSWGGSPPHPDTPVPLLSPSPAVESPVVAGPLVRWCLGFRYLGV